MNDDRASSRCFRVSGRPVDMAEARSSGVRSYHSSVWSDLRRLCAFVLPDDDDPSVSVSRDRAADLMVDRTLGLTRSVDRDI